MVSWFAGGGEGPCGFGRSGWADGLGIELGRGLELGRRVDCGLNGCGIFVLCFRCQRCPSFFPNIPTRFISSKRGLVACVHR